MRRAESLYSGNSGINPRKKPELCRQCWFMPTLEIREIRAVWRPHKRFMSNISKMKSSQLREVLPVVEECCRKLDIDFYIIGALAREIWFSGVGLLTGGTRDIDLALFVSDENQFDQLKG